MGQTKTDLPDPLEKPQLSSLSNTDDLLSQMAGEEIDRLLAEADTESREAAAGMCGEPDAGAAQTEMPASAAISAADLDEQTSRQLDDLFAQLNAPMPQDEPAEMPVVSKTRAPEAGVPKEVAAATEAAAPGGDDELAVDSAMAQQLKDVFNQLTTPENLPPKAEVGEGKPAAASGKSDSVDLADQTGAAERHVLAAEMPEENEEEQADRAALDSQEGERVPVMIRVLAAINWPLNYCSEGVRSAVGKVAVVTLVNAIMLLFYVVFFKRS